MRLPPFGYAILTLALVGVLINIGAIVFLIWRHRAAAAGHRQSRREAGQRATQHDNPRRLRGQVSSGGGNGEAPRNPRVQSTVFHHLLLVLAFCDLVVVTCCAMAYGLPDVWGLYLAEAHPYLVPYILPITHMAVMSSVYCTILISFERYVRICYLCQLRPSTLITSENFKYYVVGILVGPMIFYTPKFFEVEPSVQTTKFFSQVNCSRLNMLSNINSTIARYVLTSMTLEERIYLGSVLDTCANVSSSNSIEAEASTSTLLTSTTALSTEAPSLNNHDNGGFGNTVRNVTRHEDVVQVKPTELRENPLYYRLYYVHLNTLFASVIPLVSLLYLNISTVKALKRMLLQDVVAHSYENGNGFRSSPKSSAFREHLRNMTKTSKMYRRQAETQQSESVAWKVRRSMSHSNLAYSGSNHMLAEMDAEAGDILLPVTRRCSSVNDLTANLLSPSEAREQETCFNELASNRHDANKLIPDQNQPPAQDSDSTLTTPGACVYRNRLVGASSNGSGINMGSSRLNSQTTPTPQNATISNSASASASTDAVFDFDVEAVGNVQSSRTTTPKTRGSSASSSSYAKLSQKKSSTSSPREKADFGSEHKEENCAIRKVSDSDGRTVVVSPKQVEIMVSACSSRNDSPLVNIKEIPPFKIKHQNKRTPPPSAGLSAQPMPNSPGVLSLPGTELDLAEEKLLKKQRKFKTRPAPPAKQYSDDPLQNFYSVVLPKDLPKLPKKSGRKHSAAAMAAGAGSRRSTLVTVVDYSVGGSGDSRRASRVSNDFSHLGRQTRMLSRNARSASMCQHPSIDEDEAAEIEENSSPTVVENSGGIGKMFNMMIGRSSSANFPQESSKFDLSFARTPSSTLSSNFVLGGRSSAMNLKRLRNNSNISDLECGQSTASEDTRHTTIRRISLHPGCPAQNNFNREGSQERRLTRISIFIVWLFLFCHAWKLIPTAYEAGYSHDGLTHSNWPKWVLVVENLSHLLITLNSSINFLIYAIM